MIYGKHKHKDKKYTHYTNDGATRLSKIYVTDSLQNRKQGAETIATAFSATSL